MNKLTEEQIQSIGAVSSNGHRNEADWKPIDLGPALRGENPEPQPGLLARSDGRFTIYRGKTHTIMAEPEAGKTKLLMAIFASILPHGKVVLIDCETTATEAVETLLSMGVAPDHIGSNLAYFSPETRLTELSWLQIEPFIREADVVGIDSVTEILALQGLNPNESTDVATYQALLTKRAKAFGAAVIELDHVVKSNESRGRWASGNGHKLAGIDVAFQLKVIKPFGRGVSGSSKLSISKDRPGHLRPLAINGHKDLAVVHYTSGQDGSLKVHLDPIGTAETSFRPTYLMEKVSRAIEEIPGLTKSAIRQEINGKNDAKDQALDVLVEEGFVRREVVGQAHRHFSEKPYREEQK